MNVFLLALAAAQAFATTPAIHTEDVELFYEVYDAAGGHPTAAELQRDYLDAGSDGLRQFAALRNTTAARIAEAISKQPEMYEEARECLAILPRIRERVARALDELRSLYPEARFPPVTIAVGRGRPIAVGSPVTGIQVGLVALCANDWLIPDAEDRFVTVIAHEYAHAQQVPEMVDDEHPTVLQGSLVEGVAELVSELIAGEVSYFYLAAMVDGREKEIETAFVADRARTDLSGWLYNSKPPDDLGDLGYWVGYRIAKSYYQRAPDKYRALRDMLEMTDPQAFLAASGWYPGIALADEQAIRELIARMEAAWNRGDFRGYMEGFANPDVVFVSRGEFQRDWQGTLDHYVRDYGGSEERRGRLRFFDIRIEMLAPDAAQLVSRYQLDRPVNPQDGINTRLMRKRDGRWVIALNHVSSREGASVGADPPPRVGCPYSYR